MLTLNLALAGLGIGAIASLAGLGLLVTYRLTGVLNLAFGAIAMMAAYLLWQEVRVWHWPLALAVVVDLVVACPAFGLLLERVVFRPLQRRQAPAAERLVASLGVLVVLMGAATVVWGMQTRLDAPALVPVRQLHLPGGASVALATVVELVVVAGVGGVLARGQRTRIGLRARAVVERRDLAELQGLDTDRISSLGWAIGASLAGLAGMLMAPSLRLQPYGLTLVVLETVAVVVVARLTSAPRAVAAALAIGVAQAEMTRFHLGGHGRALFDAVTSNLFVVALLLAVVLVRRLDEAGGADAGTTSRLATRGELPPIRGWWLVPAVALAAPLMFGAADRRTALAVPALAIVLVSIVVVSGYSGQISLGQAGFAGAGALVSARLMDGTFPGVPRVPGLLVLVVAPVVVGLLGVLLGWPAIRRRGLFLALTTFAAGVGLSRFLFDQPAVTTGLSIRPPGAFGADSNFYVLELVCLAVALLVVHELHDGRLGRALLAMRDDEAGARACGIDLTLLKLLVFGVASALAGLGGALLAMGAHAFDSGSFDPIRSLVWFAAVVVFGIDSAPGAVIGAGILVAIDASPSLPVGTSTLVVGAAALMVGWAPGGVLHSVHRLFVALRRRWSGEASVGMISAPTAGRPARLSAAGRVVARRLHDRIQTGAAP